LIGREGLLTAFLAAFGRAIAEVGAIIIVGGNIRGYTRTMTTAIALDEPREASDRETRYWPAIHRLLDIT
jgi:ABC-type tungstate transport system substrate-binding protein